MPKATKADVVTERVARDQGALHPTGEVLQCRQGFDQHSEQRKCMVTYTSKTKQENLAQG